MRTRRLLFVVACVVAGQGLTVQPASAGTAQLLFEMPFPCGQDWQVATHAYHGDGDYATDWNQGSGDDDLGKGVVASYGGIATIHPLTGARQQADPPINPGAPGALGAEGAGNYVVIEHAEGWATRYLHLDTITVGNGPVRRGQQIGTVGSTGATSSHLHYEQELDGVDQHVSFNGRPIDRSYTYNGPTYRSHNCSDGVGAVRDVTGSAKWYLDFNRNAVSDRTVSYGLSSDLVVSGDWDGDGGEGIGVYRPSAGTWHLDYDANGGSDQVVRYGLATDLPLTGDWNGDGRADIGVFRASDGIFMLDIGRDGWTNTRVTYGVPTDIPVVGDWDGNGRATVGVFRPSNNTWYLDNTNDGRTDVSLSFGRGDDGPVVGDWDGDGADSIGVFRSSTGTWYLDYDNDGASDGSVEYGIAGDRVIAGDWRSP